MIAKVLLAVALISASLWELEAASSCAPDCRGQTEGALVKVPWDCRQYSVCGDVLGTGTLFPSVTEYCAEGFYFNPDDPLGPSCNAIALADPGYCVTTCNPCEPLWTFIGDTTPNPTECGAYQVCLANGVFFYDTCTDEEGGLYYDYINGGCQENQEYCFDQCDSCVPYCIEEYRGTNIPDPSDCTAYYSCDPPDVSHFECPADEIFDQTSQACEIDAPCIETCVNL